MLVIKNKQVINDGKVVMVVLTVADSTSGIVFKEVGRATCDLTTDTFNLQVGSDIAEERAYQKAAGRALKYHKQLRDLYLKHAKDEDFHIANLLKRVK